jgi:uncharacterized protein (DUF983 family)
MSWEGFSESLCENGHFFDGNVYEESVCPVCGAKARFYNVVDTTNGFYGGNIDITKLTVAVEETCILNAWGKRVVVNPTQYELPSSEEEWFSYRTTISL